MSGLITFHLLTDIDEEVVDSLDCVQNALATYPQEVITHRGMRWLLGEDRYNELCERLGAALTPEQLELVEEYEGSSFNLLLYFNLLILMLRLSQKYIFIFTFTTCTKFRDQYSKRPWPSSPVSLRSV